MVKKLHFNLIPTAHNLIFLLIFVFAFILVSLSLENIKFALDADEGYYFKYARQISIRGITGFPDLFKDYIYNPQHWLFPNPLRIGFIILSSLWFKACGASLIGLAYLSLFSYLLFLIISFGFTQKYFDKKTALLLLMLLAFSPLNLAMARRALVESTLNLFSVLSLWLFFDYLSQRSKLKTLLFVAIYSFTILIKETAVLLSLVFIAFLLGRRYLFKKEVRFIDFAYASVVPFAIVGAVYLGFSGGIAHTLETIKIILSSPKTNQYALVFGSGPWFRYIIDFLVLSPWVVILCTGFIFYYLSRREYDEPTLYFLLTLGLTLLSLSFFTKNLRYAMLLDMPLRLFAILMLQVTVNKFFSRQAFSLLLFLVLAIACSDLATFYNLFLKNGIYDPVSFFILKASRIIPSGL